MTDSHTPVTSALYHPVNVDTKEIRLLTLEAGSGDELLRCSLQHVRLFEPSTKRSYETISYVWGDSLERGSICIDGRATSVPASSKRALLRMRHPSRPRTMWIDAVCINQNDTTERSSQVALMSSIYSSSAGNLVWLGEADDTTKSALASVSLVLDELKVKAAAVGGLSRYLCDKNGFLKWVIGSMDTTLDYHACKIFFSSRWFTRRWVVQEVALAPRNTCHCGPFEQPLEDILAAAAYICYNYMTWCLMECCPGMHNASTMFNIASAWPEILEAGGEVTAHLPFLLESLQSFDNDDPRDCIFALVALYQKYNAPLGELPDLIRPDYSLALATVLTKAASLSLAETDDLRLLNEVRHRTDSTSIPSWVPRYDRKFDQNRDCSPLIARFRADNSDRWQPSRDPVRSEAWSSEISAKGYTIGVVLESSAVMTLDMFRNTQYTRVRLAEIDAILHGADPAVPRNEILGITLCAGRDYEAKLMIADDATRAFTDYEAHIIQKGIEPPWPSELDARATAQERRRSTYKHEVFHVCPRRRFFSVAGGLVGVGPQCMQPGDVLGIFFGCQWPVMLRPIPGEGKEFRFVGTAYVYGIMFGEAVGKAQRERRLPEEFVLV